MADDTAKSLLEQVVEILARHGVEFIVVGGQAESLFGSPRVTYDVDLCYRRNRDNLERLAAALRDIKPTLRGAPPDLPFRIDALALGLGSNFTFSTPFGDLDLLGTIEPIGTYDDILRGAEEYEVGPYTVRTINLDDLIRVKQHIQRPKDRDSLFQLLAIRRIRDEGGK